MFPVHLSMLSVKYNLRCLLLLDFNQVQSIHKFIYYMSIVTNGESALCPFFWIALMESKI